MPQQDFARLQFLDCSLENYCSQIHNPFATSMENIKKLE